MNVSSQNLTNNIKPWNIAGQRVLVIPDCHQNIHWVKEVIEREKGNFDVIVFLGDFFDSIYTPPDVYTARNTAKFIIELIEGKYGNVKLILGNHDLAYLEAWKKTSKFKKPTTLLNFCSGYTNSKAVDINKNMDFNNHWRKFNLFLVVNGWLLTHAGIRANYWRPFITVGENLDKIYQEYEEAITLVNYQVNPLFVCGIESGGTARWGGPLWCRPNTFEDELPLPQIFGHTFSGKNQVKQLGRCFCIDGAQTVYVIINPDGALNFKSIDREYKGPYVEKPVNIEKYPTGNEIREHALKALQEYTEQLNKKIDICPK